MSTPTALKRRRLDDGLHKPFKSPLRSPHVGGQTISPSPLSTRIVSQAPALSGAQTVISSAPSSSDNAATQHTLLKTKRPRSFHVYNTKTAIHTLSPEQVSAQKRARVLEAQIIKTRQEVDDLKQSLALIVSPRHAALDDLTRKWRSVARLAAEELFVTAREKVHRMGGVNAWKEVEFERQERLEEWNAENITAQDPPNGRDEDGETNEEGDTRMEEDIGEAEKLERLAAARERLIQRKESIAGGEEGFTMGAMLAALGIEAGVLGYSVEHGAGFG